MSKKLKEGTLREFSELVIRVACLPRGSELEFRYVKKDRRVRPDFVIKRRSVNSTTLPCPDDEERVGPFLARVQALVSTDLEAKSIRMTLRTPSGATVHGNTQIGVVREEPSLPGPNDPDPVKLFAQLLENAQPDHELTLVELHAYYTEFKEALGDAFLILLEQSRARIMAKQMKQKGA
jgi:hypothetical protein